MCTDVCVPCVLCLVASVASNSLPPCGLQPAKLLCPWDSPGKNTGAVCHVLLQGIFPTQGSDPSLPHLWHYRWILYQWVPGEAHTSVFRSTIHNSQKVETTHPPMNGWINCAMSTWLTVTWQWKGMNFSWIALIHTINWMHLENIVLSESSLLLKATNCIISFA